MCLFCQQCLIVLRVCEWKGVRLPQFQKWEGERPLNPREAQSATKTGIIVMSEEDGKPGQALEAKAEPVAPSGQGPASVSTTVSGPPTPTEDEDESEDESEILEESPCGRWQKRREEVRRRHIGLSMNLLQQCEPCFCLCFLPPGEPAERPRDRRCLPGHGHRGGGGGGLE